MKIIAFWRVGIIYINAPKLMASIYQCGGDGNYAAAADYGDDDDDDDDDSVVNKDLSFKAKAKDLTSEHVQGPL